MPPDRLRVGGIVAFSTVDFPGRLSAVLFCQGCPWRCRYCHNTHLQPFGAGALDWSEIETFLERRRGLLEAVVFSGGEPTAQAALPAAMRAARGMGFAIGLHTAGIFPRQLRAVLPLVDWVGLDIKAPFDDRYDTITRSRGSACHTHRALEEVIASGVDHELRTTVHPALLDEQALNDLQCGLRNRGARSSRLQAFRASGCMDQNLVAAAENFDGHQ